MQKQNELIKNGEKPPPLSTVFTGQLTQALMRNFTGGEIN